MAKVKFNLKRSWKSIVSMVLAGMALFGAIFGLVALSKKVSADTKEIYPIYSVGGLDADGKYEESENSIYTKKAFECVGLNISPAFDAQVSYQVYFYDENEVFLECTSVITEFYEGTPAFARYARIEITPREDDKVSWYEVSKYAEQLTISVRKNQKAVVQERKISFVESDFAQKNFTESWLLEDCSTTLTTRYIIDKYILVGGADVVVHCDNPNYTLKVGVFDGSPTKGNLIYGSGFYTPEATGTYVDLSTYMEEDTRMYLAIGFEKFDKSDFTVEDVKTLAKSFYVTYNA